jgi:ATP-dependent DNA ligase
MQFVKPQLAHRGTGFATALLDDADYVADEKLDGERAQVVIADHRTQVIYSRLGNPMHGAGLEWVNSLWWKVAQAVVDAEFWWPGCVSSDVAHRLSAGLPVHLGVFDTMVLGSKSIIGRPLSYRRAVTEELVRVQNLVGRLCVVRVTALSMDRRRLFQQICREGGEGIILKRWDAPYRPGSRCQDWVKLHNPARAKEYDVVILDVTDKATYSRDGFKTGEAAWVYGVYDPKRGEFRRCGQIGLPGPRAEKERFIGKVITASAKFQFPDSGALRHAHFVRIREDKDPKECRAGQ